MPYRLDYKHFEGKGPSKQIGIRVIDSDYAKLKKIASEREQNISELVHELIDNFLFPTQAGMNRHAVCPLLTFLSLNKLSYFLDSFKNSPNSLFPLLPSLKIPLNAPICWLANSKKPFTALQ